MENKIKLSKRTFKNSLSVASLTIENWILKQIIPDEGKTWKGAVIGLSGGVDSTLVAVLAQRGIERYNSHLQSGEEPLKLVGLMLPSDFGIWGDVVLAEKIVKNLKIEAHTLLIRYIIEAYLYTFNFCEEKLSSFDRGNMISRIRANVLHTYSAINDLIVLGTGNFDEDFGIGYYTLFGDGAVHCSPIGDLSKSMVRELLVHLGYGWNANREASAGLEEGQTDFKDLGYSYDFVSLCMVVQPILHFFNGGWLLDTEYFTPCVDFEGMIQVLFNRDKAEYLKKFGKVKFDNLYDALWDVQRRHRIANAKGSLVSPNICKVETTWR